MIKKIISITLLSILWLIPCGFSNSETETPKNEIPMYGNVPPTPEEQKIHDKFINTIIQEEGSREIAIEKGLNTAWYYYAKHDFKTAIRRFNQVWLLDPNNAQVFYGFGLLMERDSNMSEAIAFYKKSLEFDPKNAKTMCYLATVSAKKALVDKSKQDFDEALSLYEKATYLATNESVYSGIIGEIYEDWAYALFMDKNYAEAWRKIRLSREHGQKIHLEFIEELSKAMPEPK